MFGAAALTFPFQNIEIDENDIGMDKRRAIQIMAKSAGLYHLNLEDQKDSFPLWCSIIGQKTIEFRRKQADGYQKL